MKRIKRGQQTIELGLSIQDMDCFITAQCNGYYDPGQTFGPIETCYPPEGDFEAYDIEIINEETNEKIQFETLSLADQRYIEERLEEEFFNSKNY